VFPATFPAVLPAAFAAAALGLEGLEVGFFLTPALAGFNALLIPPLLLLFLAVADDAAAFFVLGGFLPLWSSSPAAAAVGQKQRKLQHKRTRTFYTCMWQCFIITASSSRANTS
jgi:hypothetical protein